MQKVAVAVVTLFLLAGCSADKSDSKLAPAPEAGAGTTPTEGNKTSPTPPPTSPSAPPAPPSDPEPTNSAPSATLIADANSGPAPLTVTFTLNGTDPDGDDLDWSLDVDGDGTPDETGTSLPTTVIHEYAAAGVFVANLTVTDGNLSASAEASITVIEPAGPGPQGQTVDGKYTLAAEGCTGPGYSTAGQDPLAAAGDELDGAIRVQFLVSPWTQGQTYTADFSFDLGYLFVAVGFYDSEDDYLGGQDTGQAANLGDYSTTGTVPVGAHKAVLLACAGPTVATVHYEV